MVALVPPARRATEEDFSRAVRCVRAHWPPHEARELLTTMNITGTKSFGAALTLRLIELEEVMLSEAYRQIYDKGRLEGAREGIEKGIEKGLVRARHMLGLQVRLRFPDQPNLLDDLLPRCTADALEELSTLIITASSAEELVAAARRLAS